MSQDITKTQIKLQLFVEILKSLWPVLSEDTKEDLRNMIFRNDKPLYTEMLTNGLAKHSLSNPNNYQRVDTSDSIPEGVELRVVWGNGFNPFQYGTAKYAHGKWWRYECENRWANGHECAIPIFYNPNFAYKLPTGVLETNSLNWKEP